MRITLVLSCITLFLSVTLCYGQTEPIDTDRPDQTETPSIVPKGHFQMENGFTHTKAKKNEDASVLPSSLWKIGISKQLELRLITELAYNRTPLGTETGLMPLIVGIKANLIEEEKVLLPKTSFLFQVSLPKVASRNLYADHISPEARLLFENSLSDTFDLGYNLGMEWSDETGIPIYEYTITPSIALSKMTKAYIESFGYLPSHGHTEHWIDGGFIFLLTDDVQLDISAGYELTATSHFHQYYESIGFSFRI